MTEREELIQLILSFTPEELKRAHEITHEYLAKGPTIQTPDQGRESE